MSEEKSNYENQTTEQLIDVTDPADTHPQSETDSTVNFVMQPGPEEDGSHPAGAETEDPDGAQPVTEQLQEVQPVTEQTRETQQDDGDAFQAAAAAPSPHWNFDEQDTGEETAEAPVPDKPVKEKKKRGFGWFVKYAVAGVLFGAALCGGFWGINAISGYRAFPARTTTIQQSAPLTNAVDSGSQIDASTVTSGGADTKVLDVSGVAENVMPSMVSIYNKGTASVQTFWGTQTYESQSSGSGIIVGQNDTELLIATNNHVVSGAESLKVSFVDDQEVAAVVKGTSGEMDLAVVAVKLSDMSDDTKNAVKVARLGDSDALKIGEPAIAIGNALGYGQSVTVGYISALNREVTVQAENSGSSEVTSQLIQTDAAINPGNSGGALLNINGEVIGINSVKYSSTDVEGMGYAIPISAAQPILDELMNRETRTKVEGNDAAALSIRAADVTSDAMKIYGMPSGAYISRVIKDGAAEKAGLKQGDIIVKLDGATISSGTSLVDQLTYYKAGETVDVVVARFEGGEYKEQTFSVTLDRKSDLDDDADDDDQEDQESPGSRPDDDRQEGSGEEDNSQNSDPFSGWWPFW